MLRLAHTTAIFSLRACAYLFAGSLVVGTLGYVLIEGYAVGEAVYMAVITLSTVGYGEVRPLSGAGRIFTSFYVVANLAITALFVSQLTQHLREGGIITTLRHGLMRREIADLRDHVVVCGGGRYGREVLDQLADSEEDIVLVERDRDRLDEIAAAHPRLLYVEGDATDDDALERANIRHAKTLIATLGDDSDNAFTVLSARQLAPARLTVIARVYEPHNRAKLERVGADHVVQPEQIGSFFMATLVRKPSAVEFFTSLAEGPAAQVGFEEVTHDALPAALRRGSLLDLDLRRRTGVSVVALRMPDGRYAVNPDPNTTLGPGMSFIALGDKAQLARLRELVGAGDGEAAQKAR